MSTGLTLYDIETDLLNLMLCREAVLDDEQYHGDEASRTEALEMIDRSIKERVSAEIAKVDGIAFYLREFAARATTAKVEAKRLKDRQDMWEAREERLKEIVTQVMSMTGKMRLEGNSNTLKLVKNPPSVEIAQPELVPSEYQKVVVRMPHSLWARVVRAIPEALLLEVGEHSKETAELSKSEIAEALKQRVPCEVCEGVGVREVYAGHGDKRDEKCLACNGTGKVNQGVPGCSLVRDKMRLEVE
jgi:Siphovirus Gp157